MPPAQPLRARRYAIVGAMKDTDIEAKIDDLARMVAGGFTEVRGELKDIRDTMATQEDLADIRQEMATKADLSAATSTSCSTSTSASSARISTSLPPA
jgi:hypothetical protein